MEVLLGVVVKVVLEAITMVTMARR